MISENICNLGTAIWNYCLKIVGGYIEIKFKFRRSIRDCQISDTIFSDNEKKTRKSGIITQVSGEIVRAKILAHVHF